MTRSARMAAMLLLVMTACIDRSVSTQSPSRSKPQVEQLRVLNRIDVEYADAIVAHEGWVWIPTESGIVRVDPLTGDVRRAEHAPHVPGQARSIATLDGFLWLAIAGGTFPGHGEGPCRDIRTFYKDFKKVRADACDAYFNGPIVEVNARTAAPKHEMKFLSQFVPQHIAAADGWIWIVGPRGLRRFDPTTRVFDDLAVRGSWRDIASAGESLWALEKRRLARIDPLDGSVEGEIALRDPDGVAFGAGSLWVTSRNRVNRIDAATMSITATIKIVGVSGIAADDENVLVRSHGDFYEGLDAVWRIDSSTAQVVGRLRLDEGDYDTSSAVALAGGTGWVFRNAYELFQIGW